MITTKGVDYQGAPMQVLKEKSLKYNKQLQQRSVFESLVVYHHLDL